MIIVEFSSQVFSERNDREEDNRKFEFLRNYLWLYYKFEDLNFETII